MDTLVTPPRLARRVREAPTSATVRIADLAAQLRRDGVDVLDFSAGRPAEPTPDYITRAAAQAMLGGDTHQTPARGRPEFRAAAARKLRRDNGITADPDRNVLATLGCKQGLTLALMASLDPGDEVLVEDPCFVSYAPTIAFCGGVAVPVPLRLERGWRWDPADLDRAVTPRTRAILICTPGNPTGTVHTPDELDAIATVAREHDLVVIADEIYEKVTWGGRRHTPIATRPGMAERTIGLMGLTKSFAMGGWRIGFAYGPAGVIDAMTELQAHLMTCAGSFTQTGAALALGDEPPPEMHELWADWEQRCTWFTGELDRTPTLRCRMPEGGFYAWTDVRGAGEGSEALAERLLTDHHVAAVPGSAFGPAGEGYLRLTCVRSWEHLRAGIVRIREALA